jgi:hypothetical protein
MKSTIIPRSVIHQQLWDIRRLNELKTRIREYFEPLIKLDRALCPAFALIQLDEYLQNRPTTGYTYRNWLKGPKIIYSPLVKDKKTAIICKAELEKNIKQLNEWMIELLARISFQTVYSIQDEFGGRTVFME